MILLLWRCSLCTRPDRRFNIFGLTPEQLDLNREDAKDAKDILIDLRQCENAIGKLDFFAFFEP